ncbi:MAG: MYG1 family protein [Verrucomicrobiota bacterium]
MTSIITHPGGAHKDDFLACALLLARAPVSIERRDPTEADLTDPRVAVVDIGHKHDPVLNNFDHHQFPKEQAPTCALSLVLQSMGLYEDAKEFCDWLEVAEWFDCRGPKETGKWLGVDREAMAKLNSPIDVTLLRRFAAQTTHQSGEPIWELMRMIGEDLVDYITSLRERLNFIAEHAEVWELDGFKAVFMPRTEPLPEEPSAGLGRYIEEQGLGEDVLVMVYPDRRGEGYGMRRFNDNPRIDFTRIESQPDVHFAHKQGFIAKTSATATDRLRALVSMGLFTE